MSIEKTIPVEANQPLALSGSNIAWTVEEGSVEVFSIFRKNEQHKGHRHFICSVLAGEAMLPGSLLFHDTRQHIIAVGLPGTIIRKSDPCEIRVEALEGWVRKLTRNLSGAAMPKKPIQIERASSADFSAGSRIFSSDEMFWARHIRGASIYNGIAVLAATPDSGFMPISRFGWLEITEDSALEILTTAALRANDGIFSSVEKHATKVILYNCIMEERLEREELERTRQKYERDEYELEQSLQSFVSIIERKERTVSGKFPDELRFFEACRLVASYSSIELKQPEHHSDNLDAITEASQIRTRQVILSEDWWRADGSSLLGFLDADNRPIALIPKSSSRYLAYDVSEGIAKQVDEKYAKTLKPFAFTFYRPLPSEKLNAWDLIKYSIQCVWKSDIAILALVGLAAGAVALLFPIGTGVLFDTIIPQAARGQIYFLGLFLLVGALGNLAFLYTQSIASLRIKSRMNLFLEAAVWDRVLRLPVPFFRDFSAGDLESRTSGISAIRQVLSDSAMRSLLSGLFSILNIILLFYYSRALAVAALILVGIAVITTAIFGISILKYQRVMQEVAGKLSGLLLQIILGIAKFRICGAEKRAFTLWAEKFSQKREARFRSESIANLLTVFNTMLPTVSSLVIFYLFSVSDTSISIGNFFAFNAAFTMFMGSMLSLTSTGIDVISVVPIYHRIKPILDALPEYDERKSDPGELQGNIEISHIVFQYKEDEPLILNDVCLSIETGEFVAIVGPSGSGKSTLIKLILGFEQPISGTIYYDGQEFSTINVRTIRKQMGVVLQSSRVMAGDIYTNIIGAQTHLTMDDAWKAAAGAGFDDDIREMPMGMYTVVNEGGTTLSGGQRQRLLIARAIVNRPRIVLFDEATSALDNRTQDIVGRSLTRMNSTRIVIAHRLSTIVNANRIVVFEKGEIVQCGTYAMLMREDGPFRDLVARQLE